MGNIKKNGGLQLGISVKLVGKVVEQGGLWLEITFATGFAIAMLAAIVPRGESNIVTYSHLG